MRDSRFLSSWPNSIKIWVPEDVMAVHRVEDIRSSSVQVSAIRRKDLRSDLARVREAMERRRRIFDRRRVIDSFLAALNRRLIASKECESEIDGSLGLSALGKLDLKSILSPVSAALKITGDIGATVQYPRGTEFEIDRYAYTIPDQSEAVIEVKRVTLREDGRCGSSRAQRHLVVSTSLKEKAEITAEELEKLGLQHNEGYPVYACSKEYFKLYSRLTGEKALEEKTAAMFLAYYARFTGGSRPAVCKPRAKR